MKKEVGLWIDHSKAVIFSLTEDGAGLRRIQSEVNSNGRSSVGEHEDATPNTENKESNGRLNKYYEEVLSHIRDAASILIFGPGDAKLELRKRLEKMELRSHIVGFETVATMTDNQIVTKVRDRFLK